MAGGTEKLHYIHRKILIYLNFHQMTSLYGKIPFFSQHSSISEGRIYINRL